MGILIWGEGKNFSLKVLKGVKIWAKIYFGEKPSLGPSLPIHFQNSGRRGRGVEKRELGVNWVPNLGIGGGFGFNPGLLGNFLFPPWGKKGNFSPATQLVGRDFGVFWGKNFPSLGVPHVWGTRAPIFFQGPSGKKGFGKGVTSGKDFHLWGEAF